MSKFLIDKKETINFDFIKNTIKIYFNDQYRATASFRDMCLWPLSEVYELWSMPKNSHQIIFYLKKWRFDCDDRLRVPGKCYFIAKANNRTVSYIPSKLNSEPCFVEVLG